MHRFPILCYRRTTNACWWWWWWRS